MLFEVLYMEIEPPKDQMPRRIGAMEGRARRNSMAIGPNAAKRPQPQYVPDRKAVPSNYFSMEAFLVLVCLTMSLLILPLVLPPLPPPPSLLLLVPVGLLVLLIVLAFMPSDVRNIASSYL